MPLSLRKATAAPTAASALDQDRWRALGPALLILTALAFFARPLLSPNSSIVWDAADQFQPFQSYFADALRQGRLPFWTPYAAAGYPFLAEPQVGAWYPLNWPFFLAGIGQRALVVEHLLHVLLAAFGAYALALRLLRSARAATLAGLCFGLSGFFVAHGSHTPMVQGAAWLPWLCLLLDKAVESGRKRFVVLAGLAAGAMILAGHFQTSLYAFLGLALFALASCASRRSGFGLATAAAVTVPVLGTLLSAIASAPGLELASHSDRAFLSALQHPEGMLPIQSLLTLLSPDHYGALQGLRGHHGPADITQLYFYGGLALLPLAALGLANRQLRWVGGLLVAIPLWYAAGPAGGLYLLMARLPGFASIRNPVHIWFVSALGLALLSAAGFERLARLRLTRWQPAALLLLVAGDLFYWNSWRNSLSYARQSYERIYGEKQEAFRRQIGARLPPSTRFDAPLRATLFGPLGHPLTTRTETTYGYFGMTLWRFDDYSRAMRNNPLLRRGLNVSLWLDPASRQIRVESDALPRVSIPPALVGVRSPEESRRLLATLDPTREALVPEAFSKLRQDPTGSAEVVSRGEDFYRIRYRSRGACVLRLSSAWYPGWRATIAGRPLATFPLDHALTGILVPAGEGEIEFRYRSSYFLAGMSVSLLTLAACWIALRLDRRRERESRC